MFKNSTIQTFFNFQPIYKTTFLKIGVSQLQCKVFLGFAVFRIFKFMKLKKPHFDIVKVENIKSNAKLDLELIMHAIFQIIISSGS